MNLRINIPDQLMDILAARAAEAGKNVEAFVEDSLRETLESEISEQTPAIEFDAWLSNLRRLIPSATHFVDDSRESIYAGRGE